MAYAPEYVPKILIVDSQGQPVRWALMQRAARYYASGKVVTDLGDNLFGMIDDVFFDLEEDLRAERDEPSDIC